MGAERRSLRAVAALADDLRHSLYAFIRRQGRPVTRDEAAAGVGISRKLAAFHLDKLERAGLLDTRHERPPGGARGPGRKPKLYEPSGTEFRVRIPERRYDLAGDILVDAIAAEADTGQAASAAREIAGDRGAELGARVREQRGLRRPGPERALHAAGDVLEQHGYEPAFDRSRLVLRNCPFHRLAGRAPELVCGLNHALLAGLVRGLDASSVEAALVPAEGGCCVELRNRHVQAL